MKSCRLMTAVSLGMSSETFTSIESNKNLFRGCVVSSGVQVMPVWCHGSATRSKVRVRGQAGIAGNHSNATIRVCIPVNGTSIMIMPRLTVTLIATIPGTVHIQGCKPQTDQKKAQNKEQTATEAHRMVLQWRERWRLHHQQREHP